MVPGAHRLLIAMTLPQQRSEGGTQHLHSRTASLSHKAFPGKGFCYTHLQRSQTEAKVSVLSLLPVQTELTAPRALDLCGNPLLEGDYAFP